VANDRGHTGDADGVRLRRHLALVVAQGKDGQVYLLDRSDLGGVGAAPLATERVINGAFIGAGAFATLGTTTYVALKGSADRPA
jgi:hypothetical protein